MSENEKKQAMEIIKKGDLYFIVIVQNLFSKPVSFKKIDLKHCMVTENMRSLPQGKFILNFSPIQYVVNLQQNNDLCFDFLFDQCNNQNNCNLLHYFEEKHFCSNHHLIPKRKKKKKNSNFTFYIFFF